MTKLKILAIIIALCLPLVFASKIKAVNEEGAGGGGNSSLGTFQDNLNSCANDGTTSLDCWIGGPAQIDDTKGMTGVLPSVANSLTTMIVGKIPKTGAGASLPNKQGGAIGGLTNLISSMYLNRPASSGEYFAYLGQNLGLVKQAYAQDIGTTGLKPVLKLWQAFRNISYLFFVIIFVLIGFAIMFRVKIDPQTVISIQNAIPKIVIALILVTFSYAIAGLLIDFIYIFIGLGVLIIAPIGGLDILSTQQKYMGLSIGEGIGVLMGGGTESIWHIFGYLLSAGPTGPIGVLVDVLTLIFAGIGGVLATLILAIIVLYVIFKLFISLLKCYINIILSIIFAPLQIMLGILPGSQIGFSAWFKNLLANIMVFPAVAIFMLLGWILADTYSNTINAGGPVWTPPVMSVPGNALVGLIALGMLLIVHKIPDMVREMFGLKPSPFGGALGEAFTPITGPVRFVTGVGSKLIVEGSLGYGAARIKESAARRFGKISKEQQSGDINPYDIP